MRALLRSVPLLVIVLAIAAGTAEARSDEASRDTWPGLEDQPHDDSDESLSELPDPSLPHMPPVSGDAVEENAGDEPVGGDKAEAEATPTLDDLFRDLRRTAETEEARRIARRIEKRLSSSGSPTIDLLMQRAGQSMRDQDMSAAQDFLDQVIVLEPGYAEAWNKRASLHFVTGRLGRSVADIEQTLAREPRHWSALLGLAAILERTGKDREALDTYLRVLTIYPSLDSAQEAAGRLSEELGGSPL